MNKRIDNLRNKMIQENIYQMIITDWFNLVYFADVQIHSGERMLALLVNRNGDNYLFVNELFTAKESDDYQIVYFNDTDDCIDILSKYINGDVISVDPRWQAGFLLRLMQKVNAKFVDGGNLMAKLRAIKDEEEREKMIKASLDNDEVMRKIVPYIKVGVTERYLYDVLMGLFEEVTGEPVSFEPIVAFGKNAADPHHESDDSVLKDGEVVLIDMGSHYHGYCSDMTRTFLQNNDKMEEIYQIVKNANEEAEKAIKPGMKFCEIDKVARDIISEAGYGPYFTHRLGHGIGLDIHEPYDVSMSDEEIIEEGMCFSIEPGIYLPNIGGVRIEDLVIVEKGGARVLNHFSKEKQYVK